MNAIKFQLFDCSCVYKDYKISLNFFKRKYLEGMLEVPAILTDLIIHSLSGLS